MQYFLTIFCMSEAPTSLLISLWISTTVLWYRLMSTSSAVHKGNSTTTTANRLHNCSQTPIFTEELQYWSKKAASWCLPPEGWGFVSRRHPPCRFINSPGWKSRYLDSKSLISIHCIYPALCSQTVVNIHGKIAKEFETWEPCKRVPLLHYFVTTGLRWRLGWSVC